MSALQGAANAAMDEIFSAKRVVTLARGHSVALSSLWIPVTSYAAQMLIMHNAVPQPRTAP
jgi:hypothetical protein